MTLSIGHSFFGFRYEEARPCWLESDRTGGPNLTTLQGDNDADEDRANLAVPVFVSESIGGSDLPLPTDPHDQNQLEKLLSLLRCSGTDTEDCFRFARLAGEAREARRLHTQNQRRFLQDALAGSKQCSGFSGIRDQHPDLVPMPDWLRPRPYFQDAFADLSIVGLPKTGTTQLYEILGSHPSMIRLNPLRKENCAVYPRTRRDVSLDAPTSEAEETEKRQLQTNLYSFVKSMAASRSLHAKPRGTAPAVTLNGCVNFASVAFTWYYLRPVDRKFILLFRDPADWMWSSWNFFDQRGHLDKGGLGSHGWVTKRNYRSPELFHELIASRSKTLGGQWLVKWRCRSLEDPRLLVRMVGNRSVLFLKNEDLVPSRITLEGGLLDKVSAFAGIDPTKFDPNTYSQVMNCNNQKGFRSKCGNMTTAYKVSGGRSLLPETRVLIYLQFWEICNIWAVEFGIAYRDCLDAANSTAPI